MRKPGRPKQKSVLTVEQIIATTQSLIIEQQALPSIRQIAQKLAVDPMAIYYYFKNKRQLIFFIEQQLAEKLKQQLITKQAQTIFDFAKIYLTLVKPYRCVLFDVTMAESPLFEQFSLQVRQLLLINNESKLITHYWCYLNGLLLFDEESEYTVDDMLTLVK